MKDFFDEFIHSAQEIIRIPSVQQRAEENAPFGKDVAKCLDYTLKTAEKLGFRTYNNGNYYGYAETGEGELFGILGHLDTVPFGDGWDYPPTSGVIVDNILYGRGVLDDKVPILSTLYAVKELSESGLILKKRIRIIFGCNEESGWKCIDKYLECEEMPAMGFSPDGDFPVINCEKGIVYYEAEMPIPAPLVHIEGGDRPNMVMDKVTAVLRKDDIKTEQFMSYAKDNNIPFNVTDSGIEVTMLGKSAHGSTPHLGHNAFTDLLNVFSNAMGGEWSDMLQIMSKTDGSGFGLRLHDDVSGDLTINIGRVFIRNSRLVISLDIRYPISYKQQYIYDTLVNNLPHMTFNETMNHRSLYIAEDHPLVSTLLDAYNKITGEQGRPISIGGGTYARALDTGVAFGPIFPGMESTIHQKNERASLDDLKKMYDIYKLAIKNICF